MNFTCFCLVLFCQCSAPEQAPQTIAICPVISPWTGDFQKRLNTARKKAADPYINTAIGEAINLRDQARKCRSMTTGISK